VTIAPSPPRQKASVTGRGGGGEDPDLLDRLRSPITARPLVDDALAGGLRAWLEDGVVGVQDVAGWEGRIVVRDGALSAPRSTRQGERRLDVPELRNCLTRVLFTLTLTAAPPRQPFEDALCALSVSERGPAILETVARLRSGDRAALRIAVQARASTMAAKWRRVPPSWLPRTGERLRIPLAGGRVVLSAGSDLVLGRPSGGTASVCLVRLLDEAPAQQPALDHSLTLRALALAETLRTGAPPWRVASYDASSGDLVSESVDEGMLAEAVRDVLHALEESTARMGTGGGRRTGGAHPVGRPLVAGGARPAGGTLLAAGAVRRSAHGPGGGRGDRAA